MTASQALCLCLNKWRSQVETIVMIEGRDAEHCICMVPTETQALSRLVLSFRSGVIVVRAYYLI